LSGPLVSVIIPTYNRLPLLPVAVRSVQSQTYENWELLIVDDGSTDGTIEYCSSIADSRVRIIACAHTGNIGAVRNIGAQAAAGEYLAFLDSDDIWLPQKLELQLERMARSGAPWSYTRYEIMDEKGTFIPLKAGTWKEQSGNIVEALISVDAMVAVQTVMVERRFFWQVDGFDEDIAVREDYDLLLRMALRGEVVAVSEVLGRIREHEGRTTRSWAGSFPFLLAARAYDKVIRRLDDPQLIRAAKHGRAYQRARAGVWLIREGSTWQGARLLAGSIADRPLNPIWLHALKKRLGFRSRQ
jgi:glycosyltransferase involved in cell wall biosynthesis